MKKNGKIKKFMKSKKFSMKNAQILLICSSIKNGENFESILKKNSIINIKKYFIEKQENAIKKVLEPNYVIITTNLAGRRIDIKISKDLEEAGGQHVIVSFISNKKKREEDEREKVENFIKNELENMLKDE